MKTALPVLLAACIAQAAHADDCQVGKGVLEWTTKDGTTRRIEGTFAHGAVSGEAKLKAGDKFTYIGSLTDGVPDGEGYLRFASELRYEGGLKMMRREGKGVRIYPNGDVYQGEFHADRPNGQGRLTYALGGVVEGEFRDGRPLDGDRITYAGSGRTGTLDAAAHNAAPARPKAENTFQQRQAEPETGTLLAKTDVRSALPTNVGWDGLTPEQKDFVRNGYPALEPGDDPPYPLNGTVEFNRLAVAVASK